ncbi:MAG TPA: hypothetical protein VL652_34805 [Kutzneria sp.]|jgi:hypothetical protein|nr:hypothetical protein [Kutzneria sp.]
MTPTIDAGRHSIGLHDADRLLAAAVPTPWVAGDWWLIDKRSLDLPSAGPYQYELVAGRDAAIGRLAQLGGIS